MHHFTFLQTDFVVPSVARHEVICFVQTESAANFDEIQSIQKLPTCHRERMENFHDTRRNGSQAIIDQSSKVPLGLLIIEIQTEALFDTSNHAVDVCRRVA